MEATSSDADRASGAIDRGDRFTEGLQAGSHRKMWCVAPAAVGPPPWRLGAPVPPPKPWGRDVASRPECMPRLWRGSGGTSIRFDSRWFGEARAMIRLARGSRRSSPRRRTLRRCCSEFIRPRRPAHDPRPTAPMRRPQSAKADFAPFVAPGFNPNPAIGDRYRLLRGLRGHLDADFRCEVRDSAVPQPVATVCGAILRLQRRKLISSRLTRPKLRNSRRLSGRP